MRLRKLTAILLLIAMLVGMAGEAFAADTPVSPVSTDAPIMPLANENEFPVNDDALGHPKLRIDFLGDNRNTESGAIIPPLGSVAAVNAAYPVETYGAEPSWKYALNSTRGAGAGIFTQSSPYDVVGNDIIFWVGVGIEDMDKLELLKDSDGLYSAELGFYYDPNIVEPYIDPSVIDGDTATDDFMRTIEKWNVGNATMNPHRWSSDYRVAEASADYDAGLFYDDDTAAVTQELLTPDNSRSDYHPTNDEMRDNGWKLLHAAIELRDTDTAAGRFSDIYGEESKGSEADEGEQTQYLLLVPFKLLRYDIDESLCFRLARNASLCSVGALTYDDGKAYGNVEYAMWERNTLRNNEKNLKVLTDFAGDLNIFTGEVQPDKDLSARLFIAGAESGNYAGVFRTGEYANDIQLSELPYYLSDPKLAPPAFIFKTQQELTKLTEGTGLTILVALNPSYTVNVTVTLASNPAVHVPSLVTVQGSRIYTVVMPDEDVIITVSFQPLGNIDYDIHLMESIDQNKDDVVDSAPSSDANVHPGTGSNLDPKVVGNKTTLSIVGTATSVDSYDEPTVHENQGNQEYLCITEKAGKTLKLDFEVNGDYYAVVFVQKFDTSLYSSFNDLTGAVVIRDGGLLITGTASVTMETLSTSIIVTVVYLPIKQFAATLELIGPPDLTAITTYPNAVEQLGELNTAQLAYVGYKPDNETESRYSGVVIDTSLPGVDNTYRVDNTNGNIDDITRAIPNNLAIGNGLKRAPYTLNELLYQIAKGGAASINYLDLVEHDLRYDTLGTVYSETLMSSFVSRVASLVTFYETNGATMTTTADGIEYPVITIEQLQLFLFGNVGGTNYQTISLDAVVAETRYNTVKDAAVAAGTWKYPSGSMSESISLDVVPGRTVSITVEAQSSMEVAEVRVVKAADGTATTQPVTVTPDGNNANVYTFRMPDEAIRIEIVYRYRNYGNVSINVSSDATVSEAETPGFADVWGYGPEQGVDAPSAYPYIREIEHPSYTPQPIVVFDGSIVTFTVDVFNTFVHTATVATLSGSIITPTITVQTLVDRRVYTYTFTMPVVAQNPSDAGNVQITVLFSKQPGTEYTATILSSPHPQYSGVPTSMITQWITPPPTAVTNPRVTRATQHTPLYGTVEVMPGYYIRSVVAYSASGTYPVTISGSGWNNGAGAGSGTGYPAIDVRTVMPNENYMVVVYYDIGPPIPDYNLLLQVVDPSAAGTSSAKISTVGGVNDTAAPDVSKLLNNPYMRYAQPGDVVTLTATPRDGSFIESVYVLPSSLGVTVTAASANEFTFIMPAASASVVVKFTNVQPVYGVTVVKQEIGTGSVDNIANTIESDMPFAQTNIDFDDYTPNVAHFHDTVTVNVDVAAGQSIVDAYVVANGSVYPAEMSSDGWGTDGTTVEKVDITFNMPFGDATLHVVYFDGEPPPPDSNKRMLRMSVYDPHNGGTAINYAQLRINDNAAPSSPDIGPLGMSALNGNGLMSGAFYAVVDDLVTVEFFADAASFFSVEAVLVTAGGRTLFPVYTSQNSATFDMPNEDATVVVRFINTPAKQYRAELIPVGHDSKAGNVVSFDMTLATISHIKTAAAGMLMEAVVTAENGYYIKEVYILPTTLGTPIMLTGSFGLQSLSFNMPAADVYVYVVYEKLWPDGVTYNLTLKVFDPDRVDEIDGNFAKATSGAVSTTDVYGGELDSSLFLYDGELVRVKTETHTGYYVESVTVTAQSGAAVSYYYSGSGEIAFNMPASAATVTVSYAKGVPPEHDIQLHITNAALGTTELKNEVSGGSIAVTSGPTLVASVGDDITISAMPNGGSRIANIYATDNSGNVIYLNYNPFAPTAASRAEFVMPDTTVAHVFVEYASGAVPPGAYAAVLNVSGPIGSGHAELYAKLNSSNTTGVVNAGASDTIFALIGTKLRVAITPETGYALDRVRVLDNNGNAVSFTWVSGYTIELDMRMNGVYVYVDFVEIGTTTYRAQLVVNDDANLTGTPNTAKLVDLDSDGFGDWISDKLITGLLAGDLVELDIKMLADYMVESIIVVSQTHGIAPVIIDPYHDFVTGFRMPADDVVIYVKFSTDKLQRYGVTLHVTPASSGAALGNDARIRSEVTTWQPAETSGIPNYITSGTRTVYAASSPGKAIETVTVEYRTLPGYYAVVRVLSGGASIPFVQVSDGEVQFPMVAATVDVWVEYVLIAAAPLYKLTVHAVNEGGLGFARGWYEGLDGANHATDNGFGAQWAQTSIGMDTVTADVHGGAEVHIDSFIDNAQSYVKAAYVIYNGYMVEMNFEDFSGTYTGLALVPESDMPPNNTYLSSGSFIMHPAITDVYVVFGNINDMVEDEYAAVLSVFSESADTESYATITRSENFEYGTAYANEEHTYVNAVPGEYLTVTITPKVGYEVDKFEVSPLLIDITVVQISATEYRVYMPDYGDDTPPTSNIAVRVTMRPALGANTVTLHLLPNTNGAAVAPYNYDFGQVKLIRHNPTGDVVVDTDNGSLEAPEGMELYLDVLVETGWYVKHAYVMSGDTMIQLERIDTASPTPIALENTVAVGARDAADASAKFRVPDGDANVYVILENAPPPPVPMRTLVVVADDTNHSGLNEVHVRSFEDFIGGTAGTINTVTPPAVITSNGSLLNAYSIKSSEFVSIWVSKQETGYTFISPPGVSPATFIPTQPNATIDMYEFAMTPNNLAIRMFFESTVITKAPLAVELIDTQNPSNGTVTNSASVTVASLPTLSLASTTTAGAAHVITDAPAGNAINIVVNPAEGYIPIAVLTDSSETTEITLTRSGSTYTGTTDMPARDATLTITYIRGYTATVLVTDITGNGGSRVSTDFEGTAYSYITFGNEYNSLAYTVKALQQSDRLILRVTLAGGSNVVSVTYTTASGTFAAPYNVDGNYYLVTLPDEDIVINVLLGNDTSAHTAFVRVADNLGNAENRATDIRNLDIPALPRGVMWTEAFEKNAVAAHFTAAPSAFPTVTANALNRMGAVIGTIVVTPMVVFDAATRQGVVYITMPDDIAGSEYASVEIMITYTAVAPPVTPHQLTLTMLGGGASGVANTATVLISGGGGINVTSTLTSMSTGANSGVGLNLSTAKAAGYRVVKAELNIGGATYPIALSALGAVTLTMPDADAEIIVYFSDKADATLRITGNIGAETAIMTTTDGTPSGVTVDSTTTQLTSTGVTLGSGVNISVDTIAGKTYSVLATTPAGTVVIDTFAGSGSLQNVPTQIINDDTFYTVVVSDAIPDMYVASVALEGDTLPLGNSAGISAIPTAAPSNGDIWTAASVNDTVTVFVSVEPGYRAVVSGDSLAAPVVLSANGTVSVIMPANNIKFTVEFITDGEYLLMLALDDSSKVAGSTVQTSVGGTPVIPSAALYVSSGDESTIVGYYSPVAAGNVVKTNVVTPIADPDVKLQALLYEDATGAHTITVNNTANTYDGTFIIPTAVSDTTVRAVIAKDAVLPPETKELFTVTVSTTGDAGYLDEPMNHILDTDNLTTSDLPDGTAWTMGVAGDRVRVTFTAAPGWFVTVTATDASGNISVVVLALTGSSAAYLDIPNPGSDVHVVIDYTKTAPTGTKTLTLDRVGDEGKVGNKGTVGIAPTTNAPVITVDGADLAKNGSYTVGERLLVTASAASSDYVIYKITINVDGIEVELPTNTYLGVVTATFNMPNDDAEIMIYYALNYKATLKWDSLVTPQSTDASVSKMKENQHVANNEVTAIQSDRTKVLNDLQVGTELDITTTPAANIEVAAVLVSATGGSTSYLTETSIGTKAYDYAMNAVDKDVTVTTIYKGDNDTTNYIAAVQTKPTAPNAGNSATIRATPLNAVSGNIWTAAAVGNTVTVTVALAAGTIAQITAYTVESTPQKITLSASVLTANGTVTFIMPASNVLVSVEFTSGKLTAQLLIDDDTVISNAAVQTAAHPTDPTHYSQLVQASAIANEVHVHQDILVGLAANERVIIYADPVTETEYGAATDGIKTAVGTAFTTAYGTGATFKNTRVVGVTASWSEGTFPVPMVGRPSTDTGYTDGALESNRTVGAGYPSGTVGAFTMPNENVKIRVVYGDVGEIDDIVLPVEQEMYIVTVSREGDTTALGKPDNALDDVGNITTAGLPTGNPSLGEFWAAGISLDRALVTFTTDTGYYAKVTAYKVVDGEITYTTVPVLQLDTTGDSTTPGRAYVQVVDSSIHVVVEYVMTEPMAESLELYLTNHSLLSVNTDDEGEEDNSASLIRSTKTTNGEVTAFDELRLAGDMNNTTVTGYISATYPNPSFAQASNIYNDLRYDFLPNATPHDAPEHDEVIEILVEYASQYRVEVRLVPTAALTAQLGFDGNVYYTGSDDPLRIAAVEASKAAALAVGPYVTVPLSDVSGGLGGSFKMPVGDITALVIYTDPGYANRPHDPTKLADEDAGLEEGRIEAVNNNDGKNLIVVVPTLTDLDEKLYDTYEPAETTPDAKDEVKGRYRYYYYDPATSSLVELTQEGDVGVTNADFNILPYDPTDTDSLPTITTDAGISPPYKDHAYNLSNDPLKIPEVYNDGTTAYTASKYRMVAQSPLAKQIVDEGALLYITYTPYRPDGIGTAFEWYEPESVLVQFVVPPMLAPHPYDPDNAEIEITYDTNKLLHIDKGWIYGDNHGEYATVIVPTLHDFYETWENTDGSPDGGEDYLFDVYEAGATPKYETFEIYYSTDGIVYELLPQTTTTSTPAGGGSPVTTNALITLRPATGDPPPPSYPYNIGNFYTEPGAPPTPYTGAHFDMVPVEYNATALAALSVEEQALYAVIRAMLNSKDGHTGSYDVDIGTLLYIKGITEDGRESKLVPLVIPPYMTLETTLMTYAPNHSATVKLYEEIATDVYATTPAVTYKAPALDSADMTGNNMYLQDIAVKSSSFGGRSAASVPHDIAELVGIEDADDNIYSKTYKLSIEKPAAVSYVRTGIMLSTDDSGTRVTEWELQRYMDATGATTRRDIVPLITGDIDGNGSVNARDHDYLLYFISGMLTYSNDADATGAAWAQSVYNPATLAYKADLNGDGRVNSDDLSILLNSNNYNRGVGVYAYPKGLILPWNNRSAVVEALVGNALLIRPAMFMMSLGLAPPQQTLWDIYEDEHGCVFYGQAELERHLNGEGEQPEPADESPDEPFDEPPTDEPTDMQPSEEPPEEPLDKPSDIEPPDQPVDEETIVPEDDVGGRSRKERRKRNGKPPDNIGEYDIPKDDNQFFTVDQKRKKQ